MVFPEYHRAPEAKYPIAIEQCYYLLSMTGELLAWSGHTMNPDTLTAAGDSVGGNMTIAMTHSTDWVNRKNYEVKFNKG